MKKHDKENLKREKKIIRENAESDRKSHNRKVNDMPGQYEGIGPQENTAIGYDPLQDI